MTIQKLKKKQKKKQAVKKRHRDKSESIIYQKAKYQENP